MKALSKTKNSTKTESSVGKNMSYDDVVRQILDKDYDDIERDIFGFSAMECLSINPETQAAFPQGNPFLRKAGQLSTMLKKYKGIYSI